MNTRRSRLSLVRRSESPMSPIGDRTRSSTSELDITSSCCSTPLNTRKRSSSFKRDSPIFNGNDQSPMPMSQDASNVVTGVSWAWNSPKRAVVPDHRLRSKPLTSRNVISNKDPDFSRSNRKKITRKLTGFHRFQTELKLLQERDETLETVKTPSSSSMEVVPPTSPPPSPDKGNLFEVYQHKVTNADPPSEKKALFFKPNPTSVASDSFNDSELDNLLLKASQAVEKQPSVRTAATNQAVTASEKPEKRRSFFKSKTADNFDGNSDDSLADAELELLLAQIHPQIGQPVEIAGEVTQNNSAITESSKAKGLLTRHKSMPESPSRRIIESRSSNIEYVKDKVPQSSITVSSTSSGSVICISTKHEAVVIPSSNGSTTTSNPSSTKQQPVTVCSKEEIEQKRQEALKRQACRLKRLMQGNHSQHAVKFTKSRK
nr:cell wall protein RBR3 [Aedes albopictus]